MFAYQKNFSSASTFSSSYFVATHEVEGRYGDATNCGLLPVFEGDALFLEHRILTVDWDLKGSYHRGGKIENLGQVLALLKEDCRNYPDALWEVQRTWAGYHAVLIGGRSGPPCRMYNLRCDQEYVDNCLCTPDENWGNFKQKEVPTYDWRLTPKHDDDFVVKKMFRVGTGRAQPGRVKFLKTYYAAVEAAIAFKNRGWREF